MQHTAHFTKRKWKPYECFQTSWQYTLNFSRLYFLRGKPCTYGSSSGGNWSVRPHPTRFLRSNRPEIILQTYIFFLLLLFAILWGQNHIDIDRSGPHDATSIIKEKKEEEFSELHKMSHSTNSNCNSNSNSNVIPVTEVYWSLVEKADKKFSKIRDLPHYQRNRFFYFTFFFSQWSNRNLFLFQFDQIIWMQLWFATLISYTGDREQYLNLEIITPFFVLVFSHLV